jgi:hypothetical protein
MSPRSVCTCVWTSVRGVMPTFLPSRDIFSCAAACRLQTATQAFHQIDDAGRSAWFVGHEFGVLAFELGLDYSHQIPVRLEARIASRRRVYAWSPPGPAVK